MEWISRNHQLFNLALQFGMLIVWLVYLQLFLLNYLRQRRSMILISSAVQSGLATRCLVSNTSIEAIYVISVVIRLTYPDGSSIHAATTPFGGALKETDSDYRGRTRQGPLASGDTRDLGSFDELAQQLAAHTGQDWCPGAHAAVEIDVEIIAEYTSQSLPIAARRTFCLRRSGDGFSLQPLSARTDQIRSRRKRRRLWQLVMDDAGDPSAAADAARHL